MEDAARALGFGLEVLSKPDEFGADGIPSPRAIPLTEPLEGPDASFLRDIVSRRPALILLDVADSNIPWERWIHVLKTSSATRRIPVIAFGPHVEVEVLDQARAAGANQVVTRGELQASLPQLITENARTIDQAELEAACEGSLSELAQRGLELLDAEEYYQAHEDLEHAWLNASELEGYLYRSLLQLSVAYLHVIRGNYAGAVKMMLRIRQWIEPLPDRCRGIDVATLKDIVQNLTDALEEAGAEGISELDRSALKPVPRLN